MKKFYPILFLLVVLAPLFSGGQSEAEEPGDPAVFEFVNRGDVEGLKKYLLTEKPVVNKPDLLGFYPLHRAVEKNSRQMALLLLNSGAEPDRSNSQGETPLLLSSKQDNRELVDLFLKWDADPLAADMEGNYPLHYGVKNKDLAVVKELVPVMDDIDLIGGDGKSPLFLAVEAGHREISSYLTEEGGDIYLESSNGTSPADLLMEKGDLPLVQAVISEKNYTGSFALSYPLLHRAVEGGDRDLVAYFMGMDKAAALKGLTGAINLTDGEGRLPLDIALSHKTSYNHALLAEYLVDQGSKRSNLREFSYVTDLFRNDDITLDLGDGITPLHYGAMMGHEGLVSLMINRFEPDLDMQDAVGGSPLLYAVRGGHERIATLFLDNGADVNHGDNYEQTAIHIAIGLNNSGSMLNLLTSRGGNINRQEINGNTALHLAVQYGLGLSVIEKIISLGGDANIRNSEGSIPLIYALTGERYELVSFLSPLSDIFAANLNDQSAVLLAMSGDMELMELFFTPHNLTLQDVEGNSALHYAATYPLDELTQEIMVYMVNAGADPNLRNARGMTPLHSAIESFYWKTANTLTSLGSDMYLANNAGETALHMAFVRGSDFSIRYLTDGVSLIEEKDQSGNTPIFHAIREFHLPLLKLLIAQGAEVNHANNFGETPVFTAVEENSLEALEVLLEAGADLTVKDNKGNTPLHFLVSRENVNWVVGDILLDGGLSLETRNNQGQTALHKGAEKGSLEGCIYLLDKGARVDPVDKNGFTPLFYSVMYGSVDLSAYLLVSGAGINKRDIRGNTVLHASVLQSIDRINEDMIALLLEADGDIFAKNKVGDTPLSLAMEVGPVTLDNLLRDDTINAINNEGDTPLHFALRTKADPAVIEIILSEGADIEAINGKGEMPALVAREQGYDQYIIDLLTVK